MSPSYWKRTQAKRLEKSLKGVAARQAKRLATNPGEWRRVESDIDFGDTEHAQAEYAGIREAGGRDAIKHRRTGELGVARGRRSARLVFMFCASNAHALAEERSDDSQQRVVGGSDGQRSEE